MEADRIRMESDSDSTFYHIYTNSDILEYECKTDASDLDSSDLDSNSDIYSIYRITFNYFLY
jgi:hypothetical protein